MNSLRATTTNLNRSRSARNLMARTLPILERGGSTRNFRELPPDRRQGLRQNKQKNSTRRFFVADQRSHGSTSGASCGANTPTSATSSASKAAANKKAANSLSNHFRRMGLERNDSCNSMESFANSTMCSGSFSGNGDLRNGNDSVLSMLSIDSALSSTPRRTPTSRSVFSSGSRSVLTSEELLEDETEGGDEDMMSLFSKDSVGVRHNQLASSSPSLQMSCRDGMSVMADDMDMLSLASSECTVYSFDNVSARPSNPMARVLGALHHHHTPTTATPTMRSPSLL